MEVEQGSPQARATMGSLHHLTSSCTSCYKLIHYSRFHFIFILEISINVLFSLLMKRSFAYPAEQCFFYFASIESSQVPKPTARAWIEGCENR